MYIYCKNFSHVATVWRSPINVTHKSLMTQDTLFHNAYAKSRTGAHSRDPFATEGKTGQLSIVSQLVSTSTWKNFFFFFWKTCCHKHMRRGIPILILCKSALSFFYPHRVSIRQDTSIWKWSSLERNLQV